MNSDYLPAPIRDLVFIWRNRVADNTVLHVNAVGRRPTIESYSYGLEKSIMIKVVARIGLAALGVLAINYFSSLPVALAIGAVISVPATAIAFGSYLAVTGIVSIASAILYTGSLATLGVGVGSIAAGVILVEYYNEVPLGVVDFMLP